MEDIKIYLESGQVFIQSGSSAITGLNTSLATNNSPSVYPANGELTASVVNTNNIKVVNSEGRIILNDVPYTDLFEKNGTTAIGNTAVATRDTLNGTRFFGAGTIETKLDAEVLKITALENATKTSTGDRGIFVDDNKGTAQSHLAVTSTTANLQAGGTTKVACTDVSTGQGSVEVSVRAGANGQQSSVTAISVAGDSQFNNALVTFSQPVTFSSSVSGIDTGDLGNVITGSPSNGDVLTWNNANQYYEPAAPTGGSGGGMSDLVDDSSPQLGGNLDVNNREIVSASNGNIVLRPNGSGKTNVMTELYADGGIEHDEAGLTATGAYGAGAEITYLGAAQTSTQKGKVYYWSGTAWTAATPTAVAPQTALLGIALGTTAAGGFLLRGFVNPNGAQTLTPGGLVYIGSQANATLTAPTSGYQRIIGHGISTTVMFFNPSQEYLKLT